MWIGTDIAVPAYDKQMVKVKVADFCKDYIAYAHYNHKEQVWYDENGHCLNDNVYKWKLDIIMMLRGRCK